MPKYKLSVIHVVAYIDRIVSVFSLSGQNLSDSVQIGAPGQKRRDSVQIRGDMDTIPSTYGKIRIRQNSYFDIFHAVREQNLDATNKTDV